MTATKAKTKRLRPGELDKLVLAYIGEHSEDGPLTASAIGKGISRSSGAVANCLGATGEGETGAPSKAQAPVSAGVEASTCELLAGLPRWKPGYRVEDGFRIEDGSSSGARRTKHGVA